jgi:hypothetical protein
MQAMRMQAHFPYTTLHILFLNQLDLDVRLGARTRKNRADTDFV